MSESEQNIERKVNDLYIDAASEITDENTYVDEETSTVQFEATAAVKLVLDDTNTADNYINIMQWSSGWTMADLLYQSPASQSAFDGGGPGQASVPKFMVSNHISAIVPKLMGGIFYEDPPFTLRPLPGTSQEIVRAKTALFSAQLGEMKFEEEAALNRLVAIARNDTGQSRRVAGFLLAWWNADDCGGFNLADLWSVDTSITEDMVTVFGCIARVRSYPDALGYGEQFKSIVNGWRP